MNDFTYSVFIAYHGTYSSNGTEQTGRRFKELLEKRYPIKNCYCGPNTDEHLFTEHVTEVIPQSQLFLLVVNDNCPKDESGAMSEKESSYLIGEIKSFLSLIKLGKRNKKDFAVFYTGNLCKNQIEAATYLRKLLKNIDPDSFLWNGNQYYIIEDIDVDSWINNRLVDRNTITFYDQDYFPFDALETKLNNFINKHDKGVLTLMMDSGMGKTTFVKYIYKYDKALNCNIFPIYINNKSNISIEEFIWDLSDRLRVNDDGSVKKCSIMPINLISEDLSSEFNKFVNSFRKDVYPNKKMLIIIDGINWSNFSDSVKNIFLMLEDTINLCDGIYILISMRRPNSSEAYRMVQDVSDDILELDKNNLEYLKFLYKYFNHNIIEQFSQEINDNSKALFNAFTPKNILAFSIYYRICRIFFSSNHNYENELLRNFGEAINFYYNFIKEKYDKSTFNSLRYILTILSMMKNPTKLIDVKDYLYPLIQTNIDFSDSVFKIFLSFNSKDETNIDNSLVLVHEVTKEQLLKDNKDVAANIASYSKKIILETIQGKQSAESFCHHDILINLLPFLLNINILNFSERNEIFQSLLKIEFNLDWAKSTELVNSEITILTLLINSSFKIENIQKAKLQAYLGFDYYIIGQIVNAGVQLNEATQKLSMENSLSIDDTIFYAELLTLRSTYNQTIENYVESVSDYEKAVVIYQSLREKNKISDAKLLNNQICLAHVYGHAKNYKKQRKQLKYCSKLLKKYSGKNKEKMNAFLFFGYAYLYSDLRNVKKSIIYCDKTIDEYFNLSKEQPNSIFCGDIMECFALKLRTLCKFYKDYLVNKIDIEKELNHIMNFAESQHFSNLDFKFRIYEALAHLYHKKNDNERSMEYCNLIIDSINNITLTNYSYDYYVKIKIRITNFLESIK